MTILRAETSKPTEGGPSFSLTHRIIRFVWNATWLLFASWTPPFFNRWRNFLLRLFGAKLDPTAIVHGSARIWYPAHLKMDAHSCLGPRVICYCMAKIHLHSKVVVSQGAHLCAGTHDIDDPNRQLIAKPIVFESGTWIAAEAFIGPGTTIGKNAVVGARSVVFKNLDSGGVYIGNPARLIRYRSSNKC